MCPEMFMPFTECHSDFELQGETMNFIYLEIAFRPKSFSALNLSVR